MRAARRVGAIKVRVERRVPVGAPRRARRVARAIAAVGGMLRLAASDGRGDGVRGMAGGARAAGAGAAAEVVPPKYLLLKWYMIMEPSSRKSSSLSGDMLPLRQCFLYSRSRQ